MSLETGNLTEQVFRPQVTHLANFLLFSMPATSGINSGDQQRKTTDN